jgi:hypothetical protein
VEQNRVVADEIAKSICICVFSAFVYELISMAFLDCNVHLFACLMAMHKCANVRVDCQ